MLIHHKNNTTKTCSCGSYHH